MGVSGGKLGWVSEKFLGVSGGIWEHLVVVRKYLESSEMHLRVPGGIWVYLRLSGHPRGNEAAFRKQLKGNMGASREGIGLEFGEI